MTPPTRFTIELSHDGDVTIARCPELSIATCWRPGEDGAEVVASMLRSYLGAADQDDAGAGPEEMARRDASKEP